VNVALAHVPEPTLAEAAGELLLLAPNGAGACLWCGSRRLAARRNKADGSLTVRCGSCGSVLSSAPRE
jgi:hypothetical protein